jgi:hypothetical protein
MSTKAADQEYKKIKREPVAVRMNTEVATLARQCAKEEYGSTEKLGTWLEDAIHHYAANRMDESRTTALLRILEESLFQRISVEIEGMHRQFTTRDNILEKRLAGLMAVSSFESCLTELMMKDATVTDKKTQLRYEELRSAAARAMKNDLFAPVIDELRAENAQLREQYGKMREAIASRNRQINWLKKLPGVEEAIKTATDYPKQLHLLKEFPVLDSTTPDEGGQNE